MEKLFGVPITQLMTTLLVLLAVGVIVLGAFAIRNPVVFRLAVRNPPRRRSQTVLIVLGLMLATVLFSASFATGDTLTHSIRLQAIENLGEVDVLVRSETQDTDGSNLYFGEDVLVTVENALGQVSTVEDVVPMALEAAPVIAPAQQLSEPKVAILGMPELSGSGVGRWEGRDGSQLSVSDLGPQQVYASEELAEELNLVEGDRVDIFLDASPETAEVAGIFIKGGVSLVEMSVVMPLSRLQSLTGNEERISVILISNQGDEISGARHSDAVTTVLDPLLDGTGLEAVPVKQDALDDADEVGSSVSSVFLIFGQFSIAAGILLIFLIFVMLAGERKHELGVARAIGAQRGHVIRMFTFEGALYALMAAAVGSVLGLIVGWVLVRIMAIAFGQVDLQLVYSFNWRSLIIAFALGMVVTFIVVVASSWQVSRLNIVAAIRDLREPRNKRRGWFSLVLIALPTVLGSLMAISGYESSQMGTFMGGTSLVIIGITLIARRLGVPDRMAFTVTGLALVTWWLLPEGVTEAILPDETEAGIEMFFLSGIMLVLGGSWALMYNYQLLLGGAVRAFGRIPGLAPVLKTAVSYPMQNRFRTGVTVAMFSLVVFTLVVMAFITAGISGLFDDTQRLSGGYDLRATVGYANPIDDMPSAIADAEGLDPDDFEVIGGLIGTGVQVTQVGVARDEPEDLFMQGADSQYSETVSYAFKMRPERFETDAEVWSALRDQPGKAIIPTWMVPARVNYDVGGSPSFQLSGFYLEDEVLPDDLALVVHDQRTGNEMTLQVIGVAEALAVYMPPIMTSRETMTQFLGEAIPPQSYMFRLTPGVDPEETGKAMESTFMQHGFEATATGEEINDGASASIMFNQLIQGFMALGLVVGIAALGVISARSVVERRHEIGMLRAVGFQKSMIQLSFLMEASFIALLGILLGTGLAIGLVPQILASMEEQFAGLQVQIPWLNLGIIIGVAYLASLLTTFLPARQASKVYPAEALRYE